MKGAAVSIEPEFVVLKLREAAAAHRLLDEWDVEPGYLWDRLEAFSKAMLDANETKRDLIDRTRAILREFNHVEGESLDDIAQVAVDAYHHASGRHA